MVPVLALLIPIVLSAVLVFIASSIIHMATPWHKNDLKKVPNEDAVMSALRPFNLPVGNYGMPKSDSMKEMRSPEFLAKFKAGPVAFLTIRPSDFSMGPTLVQWFLYSLVVSIFALALPCEAAAKKKTKKRRSSAANVTVPKPVIPVLAPGELPRATEFRRPSSFRCPGSAPASATRL